MRLIGGNRQSRDVDGSVDNPSLPSKNAGQRGLVAPKLLRAADMTDRMWSAGTTSVSACTPGGRWDGGTAQSHDPTVPVAIALQSMTAVF